MKKLLSFLVIGVVAVLPLSVKAFSLVPSCEKSCPTEDGKCEQTCKIEVKNNTDSLTSIAPTLTITGDSDKITLKSIQGGEGWEASQTRDGNVINLSFLATSPVTASNFTLATFVLELEDKATDCSLSLKNGEVTVEIETDVTEEVETGATIPLAILACAVVAGGAIYLVTKKNKKLYKI